MQLLRIVSLFCVFFCIVGRFGFLVWLNGVSLSIFRIENISNKKKLNISYHRSNFQKYQKNSCDLLAKSFKCNNYEVFKTFKDF